MPSAADILRGLARVANDYLPAAIAWHAVVAAVLLILVLGWRPERRVAAAALAAPAASVSALAWLTGNPFNGTAFLIITLLLGGIGARLPRTVATRGPAWAVVLGAAVIAYAWVYPHFLGGQSALWHAVASPMGLVPCPTLGLIVGFGLIAGGFGSRPWTLTAAIAGLFYGLFGVLHLGVWLDAGLLIAAGALFSMALSRRTAPRSRRWVELHSM